ncbi:hypothetical protein CkaCkLH20_04779 [Colletotrichum karsti]|uniref:FAD-binding domain-containing protein n=1 Tax=Colletotrichum karsti TaxID=1095194 RepID=A0A9P6I7Z7_9PEZI|nr:uncharacterized protein CkaCkLH20_04779 [Colletotrichum karsti]KAF9877644.1 hypothetical protein CkaCkLH20_04779 [Colletotrichum karsti]
MSGLKIAIIGAGPAGCLLARLLHLSNIEATIFEGESSLDFRSQGGTLDLHTDTGLLALKEAGLFDEFLRHARYDGQYMAIVDKNNKHHFVRTAEGGFGSGGQERPEIDRPKLRQLLAESLPKDTIKWGHHLKSVGEDGTLDFGNTSASGFDLVIGADGAWSKVRQLLAPDVKPLWTKIGLYSLSVPDAEKTAPELYKLVNRGSVFANSDGKRITIQQMGDGSLNVYASVLSDNEKWSSPEVCGYDSHDLEAVKKALLEEYKDWSPALTEAIVKAEGECAPRSLYMLPVGFKWPHRRGATAIGDAAGLMTPYAGEGVNVAMDGAMKLAKAIIKAAAEGGNPDILDRNVEAFETEMFPRLEKVQRLTEELMNDNMFTPGSPQTTIAKSVARHARFETPWIFHPLVTVSVHSYFFMRGFFP